MPRALADRVKESAHRNRRSLNAELIYRLEESLALDALDGPVVRTPALLSGDPPRLEGVRQDRAGEGFYALSALWESLDEPARELVVKLCRALARRCGS